MRLHEYKRQVLKVLPLIPLYNRLKTGTAVDVTPQLFLFGAKAAPGYVMAKLIIKLINDVAAPIRADADARDRLRVVSCRTSACHGRS
jgi:starch phosphorylase